MRKMINTERVRNSFKNLALKIAGIMIPILQFLPAMGIWRGLMSIPLIGFIALMFQHPIIFESAIQIIFIDHYYGRSVFVLGFIFLIFSFIFQLYNRKMLIEKGPYKYFKHPQYIAICLMTLGLSILCYTFYSSSLIPFTLDSINKIWIAITWIVEVFLYVMLAKIENFSLKARYGDYYLDYTKSVQNRWEILKNFNETEMRILVLAILLVFTSLLDYYIMGIIYQSV
jgi:protein-S-isoprenylcysteine O-methyltransferase Ste14